VATKKQDFEMWEGDTQVLRVSVTDKDGNPVNLVGFDLKWVLKRHVGAPQDEIVKTLADGISLDEDVPEKNVFEIRLEPADTLGLSGTYYHEAEGVDVDGNVSTLMVGRAVIYRTAIKSV